MQETQETLALSLGWEDPLEKEMATYFSILARKIAWIEEPGGLQYMRPQRVWGNWALLFKNVDGDASKFLAGPFSKLYIQRRWRVDREFGESRVKEIKGIFGSSAGWGGSPARPPVYS